MIDLVLLGLIALSAILGMFRGLLAMVMGIACWVVAIWSSRQFGQVIALRLAGGDAVALGDLAAGHALAFLAGYVAVALAGRLLRGMVESIELTALDRLAGLLLGIARGVLIAVVLVLIGSLSPLVRHPGWSAATSVHYLEPWSERLRAELPGLAAAALQTPDESDMGKPPRSGDNPSLNDNAKGHPWPAPLSPSP